MERVLTVWLALLTALCAGRAAAQRNHSVFYDQSQGLNSGEVSALAQDRDGFLWLGTFGGLVRFDGRTFKSWGREHLHEPTMIVVTHGDELIAATKVGVAYQRRGDSLEPWRGPQGRVVRDLNAALFDAQGRLWAVLGERVWRRDPDGRWHSLAMATIDGEIPWRLWPLRDGVALVTDRGAWRLNPDASAQRLLSQPGLFAVAGGGDAPYWFVGHRTEKIPPLIWRKDARGLRSFLRPHGRAIDLVERGGLLWLSLDHVLVTVSDDGSQRLQDLRQGVPSGGPLLIDREASLWLGTFVGLLHFPGPRTWQWTELEGMPSNHVFRAAPYRGQMWITTWAGVVRFDADAMRRLDPLPGPLIGGVPCEDSEGGLWLTRGGLIYRLDRSGLRRAAAPARPLPEFMSTGCAVDAQRRWWLNTTGGLFRIERGIEHDIERADTRAIELAAASDPQEPTLIALTERDELLRVGGGQACWYRTDTTMPLRPRHCIAAPRSSGSGPLQRVGAQRYWYASVNGLQELRGETIRRLPGNDSLPVNYMGMVRASPRGGYWVAGGGSLWRLAPCDECAQGWRVLEQPGAMQGMPGNAATGAFERDNGDLWVVGNRGVIAVPASERQLRTPAPNVRLVRVTLDGREHDPDQPLRLSPQQRRLDLEYAALTYRDRGLLRFRSRTSDRDRWSKAGNEATLQLIDLPAGDYRVQMQASLDGRHWSSARAFAFQVAPSWWATWWARLIWLSALVAVGVVLYRLRVRQLLRLERQRNEIAMDLHDEMGSGLGSISVLANVAAREGYDEGERRQIAGEIASVAELLGGGLRSLVWTMRESRAGLADLAAQLAQHAGRLLPGPAPELRMRWPEEFPPGTVRPQVRRHVLMIALEALHNAARHAHAAQVVVELSAQAAGWRLRIDDDGVGFDPEHPARRSGLDTMRQRARAIGARLELDSAPGAGTRIAVYFEPFGG
ncbi:ATP-binding protein [Lysobacter sp. TAB13]|uniref:sensor histidine kinase n=1 Tax=Lysobacter sp. TAB13 TaxID=3233065 RepID=UPI003F9AEFEF